MNPSPTLQRIGNPWFHAYFLQDPKWRDILPVAAGGTPLVPKQQPSSGELLRGPAAPPIPTYNQYSPTYTDYSPAYHHSDTAYGTRHPGYYSQYASPIEHSADLYIGLHRGGMPYGYSAAGVTPGTAYAPYTPQRGPYFY